MKKYFVLIFLWGILHFPGCNMFQKEDPNWPTTLIEVEDYQSMNKGAVVVIDGLRQLDTIPFNCIACDVSVPENFKPVVFDLIINESTERAKSLLNNPRSFKPISISILPEKIDSLKYFQSGELIENLYLFNVDYLLVAANAFGVESELEQTFKLYIQDGEINDSIDMVKKLPDLTIEGIGVNRPLFIIDESDGDYISIIPTIMLSNDLNLIVSANVNCMDKNARLIFKLKNGEEVRLQSWNDFNCDPVAYYRVPTNQLNMLSTDRIESIMFSSQNNFVMVWPPLNEADYFIQLAEIL